MKYLLKPVVAAGLMLVAASPLVAVPASAQVVKGVGIVDMSAVRAGSSAFKTSEQQRPETYKQYYDQARTRSGQIEQQLDPMIKKLQADSKLPTANREELQKQANVIQQIDQQGQRELNQILAPVALSQQYVDEQIADVLPQAIDNAAKKKSVSLILERDSGAVVYRDPSYNMNQDVIDEINALLPVAQLVPPPGWLPREQREQQARAAAAQGDAAQPTAPATAPAGPPVEGR